MPAHVTRRVAVHVAVHVTVCDHARACGRAGARARARECVPVRVSACRASACRASACPCVCVLRDAGAQSFGSRAAWREFGKLMGTLNSEPVSTPSFTCIFPQYHPPPPIFTSAEVINWLFLEGRIWDYACVKYISFLLLYSFYFFCECVSVIKMQAFNQIL